jgi:mannitol-1-/sugar-/sorbitol-6-phosphatase
MRRVMICAEDVANGKLDPEAYLTGASRLGLPPQACMVVIEDAPRVIGVATTYAAERLNAADNVVGARARPARGGRRAWRLSAMD